MHEKCLEVWRKTCYNWVPNGLRTRKHCVKQLNDLSSVVWGENMLEYNEFDWLQVLEMHEDCLKVCRKTCWNWVPNGLRTRKLCVEPLNDLSSVVWG